MEVNMLKEKALEEIDDLLAECPLSFVISLKLKQRTSILLIQYLSI